MSRTASREALERWVVKDNAGQHRVPGDTLHGVGTWKRQRQLWGCSFGPSVSFFHMIHMPACACVPVSAWQLCFCELG